MLDFLLRYATVRNLVFAGVIAASVPFAVASARTAYGAYMKAVYPPVRASSAGDDDIRQLLEQREAEKILSQYRRVTGLIEDAKELGYNVDALRWKANEALRNNFPGRRPAAMQTLTELEMVIPRKKVQYIPINGPAPKDTMDEDDDAPPATAATTKTKAATDSVKKRPKSKPRRHS
jgi:hypothetical protein